MQQFKHILFIAMAAMMIAWCSCTNECLNNQSSIGLAGFYDSTTKESISVGNIDVYGIGAVNDSVLLSTVGAVTQFYMPLPVIGSECSYVIHYTQSDISSELLNDTITLYYDAIPYFAGSDCGAMYVYDINDFIYTRHIVDSVAIPTMKITNVDTETIKLYMRTSSSTD